MKGHVGLFMMGLGVAAAGAFVYDKVRSGEIDAGEIGDRIKEVSHEVAHEMGQMKDNVLEMKDRVTDVASMSMVDINECSREDLRHMGVPEEIMDRFIEGRPYRNKMDLLTRMIIPQDIYDRIKSMVEVHHPEESVKVA